MIASLRESMAVHLKPGTAAWRGKIRVAMWRAKKARCVPVKYWEIIADNLHKAGWSLGWGLSRDSSIMSYGQL
jgi:hypothetical protein